MEHYKIVGCIGQGASGSVYKAWNLSTRKIVALKNVTIGDFDAKGLPRPVLREILCLKLLNHENINRLLDILPHHWGLTFVLEYMPKNLHRVIENRKTPLPLDLVRRYLFQLLQGAAYMHRLNIIHRDLKPSNILLNDCHRLQIADFGLARLDCLVGDEPGYTPQVYSRWYRAPELLLSSTSYTKAADIWAVGCIFAEMLTGKPLFPGKNDIEQLALIFHQLGTPSEATWPGITALPDFHKITFDDCEPKPIRQLIPKHSPTSAVNLVRRLLKCDPEKRPTSEDALRAPYFAYMPEKWTARKWS